MSDAKLRMVEVVLHWAWHPIGVRGATGAIGEYDSYAPSALALLEQGCPVDEIAAYLGSVESERMGLKPHRDKNEDVAALLRELHALLA
jgi:hypothetical protein